MGSTTSSPVPAAEAALLYARAAAETTRAAADAAATKARAEADAAAVATAAAVTKMRAEADVAAIAMAAASAATATKATTAKEAFVGLVPLAFGLAVVGALAADLAFCESPTLIRRRMLRTLRACRLPPSVPAERRRLLPVPQAPLVLGPLPTMLLGPTGCGKSTLLAELARATVDAHTPAPVVLVRLRLPSNEHGSGARALSGKGLMDAAAAQFYTQIGYPLRRSFLGAIFARGFTLKGEYSQAELAAAESVPRLIGALTLLFSVCAELRNERAAAGVPALDAAPVLLFDEVQDLIKDSRLKSAGGEAVFDMLAALIVSHCVDRTDARAVVTGSSAELNFAFSETVARGNRWHHHDLADPAPGVVVAALIARGYAEADAHAMVALCGTRLRLLARPLALGAADVRAAAFLDRAAAAGSEAFADTFKKLDRPSAAALARTLDAVAECGAGGAPADGALVRPTKESLPAAVRAIDIAPILYVDRESGLFFQSELHARTWARVRSKYAARSTEMA